MYMCVSMKHVSQEQLSSFGLLALRVTIGVIFIYHGWMKLGAIDQTAAFFGSINIPLAGIMAWVVALAEFVGGIAILAGIYTRFAAKLLAIIMIVALLTAHLGGPWKSAELPIALLGGLLAIATIGGGNWQCCAKSECMKWCKMCKK